MPIRYLILYLAGLLWLLAGCGPPAAPAPTLLPTATPQPVWGILFSGIPCPKTYASCDNTLLMDEPVKYYFINSDGTGFRSLTEAELSPPGLDPDDIFRLRFFRFSHDGSHLAYIDRMGMVTITPVDEFKPLQLTAPDNFSGFFDFLPEENCLAFYTKINETNQIIIEKRCTEPQSEPEVLAIVTFPEIKHLGSSRPFLSAQADKLLLFGGDQNSNDIVLYLKILDDDEPPNLLFRSPNVCPKLQYNHVVYPYNIVRWQSSDDTIEFLINSICDDGQTISTFFMTDWTGQQVEVRLRIYEPFDESTSLSKFIEFGEWSPDNQEFVFAYPPGFAGEISGLYKLDFESGEIQQILSEFYVVDIRVWQTPITD